MGDAVRSAALIIIKGGVRKVSCSEGSKAVPACPSDKGRLFARKNSEK